MTAYHAKPERYLDENLTRPLDVYTSIDGTSKKFVGNGAIEVPGYGKMTIQFEIEADSIDAAYEQYEAAFAAELKRMEEESKASQITAPKKDIII